MQIFKFNEHSNFTRSPPSWTNVATCDQIFNPKTSASAPIYFPRGESATEARRECWATAKWERNFRSTMKIVLYGEFSFSFSSVCCWTSSVSALRNRKSASPEKFNLKWIKNISSRECKPSESNYGNKILRAHLSRSRKCSRFLWNYTESNCVDQRSLIT